MPSQFLRNFLRIYQCYNIIYFIIRGYELVLVSINRLIYVLHINWLLTALFIREKTPGVFNSPRVARQPPERN